MTKYRYCHFQPPWYEFERIQSSSTLEMCESRGVHVVLQDTGKTAKSRKEERVPYRSDRRLRFI
jgi:hypothetical protein